MSSEIKENYKEIKDEIKTDSSKELSKFEDIYSLILDKVQNKLKDIRLQLATDVDNRIENVIEDLNHDIVKYKFYGEGCKELLLECEKKKQKQIKSEIRGQKLPSKIFIPRNSLLTDLFEIPHIRSIYHIFLVILVVVTSHTIIHDYVVEGRVNIGLSTITEGFGKLNIGLGIWLSMLISKCCVYLGYYGWATLRNIFQRGSTKQKTFDRLCAITFVMYQIIFSYTVSYYVVYFNIPLITSMALLLEMTRFMMKAHSFIRLTVPRQLAGKQKIENNSIYNQEKISKFSNYIYFLFAPTLIYRDEYPRTKIIRWKFVLWCFLELIAIMLFVSNLYERYLLPSFKDYGKIKMTSQNLIVALFGMLMPGLLIFLCGFYCILHTTQNAAAEILCFADRMFYKDWWTATNYDGYYRTWNIIVHDWLYEFVYKDTYYYIYRGSKLLSGLTVFMVSAFVHEYILAVAMRFIYPVMFSFFGIAGVILIFLTRKFPKNFGNLFLWLTISLGNGTLISLYCMEYYARINCSVDNNWSNLFIPVSWKCNGS